MQAAISGCGLTQLHVAYSAQSRIVFALREAVAVCLGLVGVTHTAWLGVVLSGLRSGHGPVCSVTGHPRCRSIRVVRALCILHKYCCVGMNVDVNPKALHGACVRDRIT